MTKAELKMVLHIIDTYTEEKENGYCGMYGYSKYIAEQNINKLKNKLIEIFQENDDK